MEILVQLTIEIKEDQRYCSPKCRYFRGNGILGMEHTDAKCIIFGPLNATFPDENNVTWFTRHKECWRSLEVIKENQL